MSIGYPDRQEAHRLLAEAEICNPGPWGDHSRNVAMCAVRIAEACGMNAEKAYVLGLLHDIGRKFGIKHLAHVWDGYHYMLSLGYSDAARICLTHSFNFPSLYGYIGKRDIPEEQQQEIQSMLNELDHQPVRGAHRHHHGRLHPPAEGAAHHPVFPPDGLCPDVYAGRYPF